MRIQDSAKWDYGHALVVAGSYGRVGCAILAAKAALRSGCGMVTACVPSRCVDAVQSAFPEAMLAVDSNPYHFSAVPHDLGRYQAIAVGPGIGCEAATARALHDLLVARDEEVPLVLDADALNILAEHREWLELCRGAILTPHVREYERLFGEEDPVVVAELYGLTIVLKHHRTVVYAPGELPYENATGNAGMATAGSGDVLTGMLAGMLAQRPYLDWFRTVCVAVRLHGLAGDRWVERHTESGLIASDLVDELADISTEEVEGRQ